MAVKQLRNFDSSNTQDRLQYDNAGQALKVYNGTTWDTVNPTSAPTFALDAALLGATTPLLAANMSIANAPSGGTALTTDVPIAVAIILTKGTLVTSLGFVSGNTALAA